MPSSGRRFAERAREGIIVQRVERRGKRSASARRLRGRGVV